MMLPGDGSVLINHEGHKGARRKLRDAEDAEKRLTTIHTFFFGRSTDAITDAASTSSTIAKAHIVGISM
jgi:hypothetical protein